MAPSLWPCTRTMFQKMTPSFPAAAARVELLRLVATLFISQLSAAVIGLHKLTVHSTLVAQIQIFEVKIFNFRTQAWTRWCSCRCKSHNLRLESPVADAKTPGEIQSIETCCPESFTLPNSISEPSGPARKAEREMSRQAATRIARSWQYVNWDTPDLSVERSKSFPFASTNEIIPERRLRKRAREIYIV